MNPPSLRSLHEAGEGPPEMVKPGPSPPPRCQTCGRVLTCAPVTRTLSGSVLGFCSGQCAAEFDRRLADPWRGGRPPAEA